MKIRILSLIVAALIIFPSLCIADNYNPYETRSNDDLVSEYLAIQKELLSRNGGFSLDLHTGKYMVGKDIPSGVYRLECKGAFSSSQVRLYSSTTSVSPQESHVMAEMYNSSIIGKIELAEGSVLEISGSTITLSSFSVSQIESSLPEVQKEVSLSAPTSNTQVDGLVVAPGKYMIGSDIPAGTYRVVCKDASSMSTFSLFDNEKSIFPSFETILNELFGNAEIGKIELKTGNRLEIAEGSVTLYVYDGLH